ncbi:MAG: alanine:cation symporter family protein, partial [Lachnospiraceae bacterium]|nr:alanine:cation symporter family protein [Lachnospiraceae bacterium]
AMGAGGPGAVIWMWLSALFGLSAKYSECMLAVKFRHVNAAGEMSGGPMYTMERGFGNRRLGRALGWCFALFAVLASFGIGNMTQANSISESLGHTFGVPSEVCGIVLMALTLCIMLGGIRKIAGITAVVVPIMAVFYMVGGIAVILGNAAGIPEGLREMFRMAFSAEAVCGGVGGTLTASMLQSLRFGVARGIFSNEAGMGSAAITAAAAAGTSPVRQGYINMTGTFWDTLVVCSITGLCIASSGVLGTMQVSASGVYRVEGNVIQIIATDENHYAVDETYFFSVQKDRLTLHDMQTKKEVLLERLREREDGSESEQNIAGVWRNAAGRQYDFGQNGDYMLGDPVQGAALTILAFETVLGEAGSRVIS